MIGFLYIGDFGGKNDIGFLMLNVWKINDFCL